MKRVLYSELLNWKQSKRRKPLLLQGARQVGKTYLVNQFAENEYAKQYRFNFERDESVRAFFKKDLNPKKILDNLSMYVGERIEFENTLIFFDEIQVEPNILTSLKYFNEELPDFNIIAAGSLLGVSVGKENAFPVGKVNFLTLNPLSFTEFLNAVGEELLAYKLFDNTGLTPFPVPIHEKLLKLLSDYLYVGGMPEAVQSYIDEGDVFQSRSIQQEILKAYERDFSKYATKSEAVKTFSIWQAIPAQLAKENKKFQCAKLRKGARFASYESSLHWLKASGLVNIVRNIKTPKEPLPAYAEQHKFKIYLLDTGLLGAMLDISPETILNSKLFSEFKGAFIENLIAMELKNNGFDELFYWTSNSDAEVDFIVKLKDGVFPVEVKSGLNRNIKSLRSYWGKYHPDRIFRMSPRNFEVNNEFVNLPLYASCLLGNL